MSVFADMTVFDGKHALWKFSGHAEESRDPHPKQGAGSSGYHGGSHADDIAGADGSGKRGAQSAKAAHLSVAAFLVFDHVLQRLRQLSDLKPSQTYGHENSGR